MSSTCPAPRHACTFLLPCCLFCTHCGEASGRSPCNDSPNLSASSRRQSLSEAGASHALVCAWARSALNRLQGTPQRQQHVGAASRAAKRTSNVAKLNGFLSVRYAGRAGAAPRQGWHAGAGRRAAALARAVATAVAARPAAAAIARAQRAAVPACAHVPSTFRYVHVV